MLGDDVEQVLQAQLSAGAGRVRGVRYRLATVDGAIGAVTPDPQRPHLMHEPEFRRGFARLGPNKMSFDAWIYHTQIEELIELADLFPDATIVLNHIGGPIGVAEYRARHAEVLREWQALLRAAALRPNVHLKVGGMGMAVMGCGLEHLQRPADSATVAAAWKPFIETAVAAFGTERCMCESNFPVDQQSCGFVHLWNSFKLVTRNWLQQERSDLFYRTACRVYNLPTLARVADELSAARS